MPQQSITVFSPPTLRCVKICNSISSQTEHFKMRPLPPFFCFCFVLFFWLLLSYRNVSISQCSSFSLRQFCSMIVSKCSGVQRIRARGVPRYAINYSCHRHLSKTPSRTFYFLCHQCVGRGRFSQTIEAEECPYGLCPTLCGIMPQKQRGVPNDCAPPLWHDAIEAEVDCAPPLWHNVIEAEGRS